MERIRFGDTGLTVSRLSIGTGTNGWNGRSRQTELGVQGLADLLCAAYERGINFWDSADQYGSHPHVRAALRAVPRDDVVITTKSVSSNARAMRSDLDRFRLELGTEVLDIVLLHCMARADWSTRCTGAMEALAEAKQSGAVRAVGVSCHNLGALRTAAAEPWVDVVLARINYAGIRMDAGTEEVVEVIGELAKNGKAVYGMKVLGCGDLAHDPGRAIRFALAVPGVLAVTIGMSDRDELRRNVDILEEWERARAA